MAIRIENDHTEETLSALKSAVLRALERCGSEAEGYAKDLCPVDTGTLRNSIAHQVKDQEEKVYIGTNEEYAPYVELGTGTYVQGGRPTPWVYKDSRGKWHWTRGNKAKPYLKPSVADHVQTYKNIFSDELKGS